MRHFLTLCVMLLATFTQAVEVGPYKVTKIVDGDTIKIQSDLGERTVRILYVDTPESTDNSHGKKMDEGLSAKAYLSKALPIGTEVKLWGPDKELEQDRYSRLLAIPMFKVQGTVQETAEHGFVEKAKIESWHSVVLSLILNGHTPYWRKYGEAPEPMHSKLVKAHRSAKEANIGAWSTAPRYMNDKTNERTAPKDQTKQALKTLDSAIADELYKAELEKHPTHTHWLNGETRHNKDCQYFGVTKKGTFCTKDEGVACKKCDG